MPVGIKKTGLGRGLEALIPRMTLNTNTVSKEAVDQEKLQHIAVSSIKPNPNQPRKTFDEKELEELADSIRIHGIISPLVVAPIGDGAYELIAGERRWRAAQLVGLEKVPCLLRTAKEMERLELAIVENVQRQNLNPIEKAQAYDYLITQFNLTAVELANRLGISDRSLTNTRRLLKLPQEVQEALSEKKISEENGMIILGGENTEQQMQIFEFIVKHRPKYELARDFVTKLKKDKSWDPDLRQADPIMVDHARKLEKVIGVPVRFTTLRVKNLNEDAMSGFIKISFSSRDEYFMVMQKLLQQVSDDFVV